MKKFEVKEGEHFHKQLGISEQRTGVIHDQLYEYMQSISQSENSVSLLEIVNKAREIAETEEEYTLLMYIIGKSNSM